MKVSLKITLIASLIGTAVAFWVGQLGLAATIWPAYPQMAVFIATLIATIVVQVAWPRDWLQK